MTLERLTGSPERPLDAPLLTFDIPALLNQMKQESTWQKAVRNAITLLKAQGLRVVLVAMHASTGDSPPPRRRPYIRVTAPARAT